jgi:hypothetical protein
MATSSISLQAQWDSRQVQVALAALAPRQWAFATALALSRVGQEVKDREKAAMQRVFDRPTAFTLNSLRVERARRDRLHARVWFKDTRLAEAGHYLEPQVHGGERRDKQFERDLQRKGFLGRGKQLVPTSAAPLDAHGNVRGGLRTRILSQLRAHHDPLQNETAKSRRRNRNKAAGRYFYGNPQGMGWGVWERVRGGRVLGGRMSNRLVPIFRETRKNQYRPRFPFFDIAQATTDAEMQRAFEHAAAFTLRTAR